MLLWHPLRIATSDPIYNVVEATDAIQKATSSCVAAWASRYESVLHLLSGGLDSSVVAMYLQRATVRPRVTYLNIRNSHDASSDERRYARVVAQSTGFPMEEHEQNVVFSLHNRLAVPRTESPFNNFYLLAPEDRTTQLATSLQARGLFTGEGGDQIFYQNGARFAWRDFARMRGPRPALLRSAFDAARIEGETIWSLFFREPLRAPLASLSSGLASQVLIDSNVRESVAKNRKFLHPWVDGSEPALPGKFWHALLLSGAVAEEMYGPLGSSISPERVSPLVSQPLVEICLRIPTFVLISGGHERALARRAFCSVVPREILTRPTKAALYDSAKALLAYNLELIRELLLDGILVRQGILDRKPLERFLSGTATDIRGHAPRVLTYVLCEVWLQSWSHTQRAAA
jgi:Asparagine synthase (glutamine-hydrolyzing)